MIALAKTALLCSRQPSDLACIADEEIAFAFNLHCADILNEREMEREAEKEKRQMELLTGQMMTSAGVQENTKVDRW